MSTISFLFGAGAEIELSMPSGEEFSLEIFRRLCIEGPDKVVIKSYLASQLENRTFDENYKRWLLGDAAGPRRISMFGSQSIKTLTKSSLKFRKALLKEAFVHLDQIADSQLNVLVSNCQSIPTTKTGFRLGSFDFKGASAQIINLGRGTGKTYSSKLKKLIKSNGIFSEKLGHSILDSDMFCRLFLLYGKTANINATNEDEFQARKELGDILHMLIQLYCGVRAEDLAETLNNSQVSINNAEIAGSGITPNEIDISLFDLGDIFSIDYDEVGAKAFSHICESTRPDPAEITGIHGYAAALAYRILEKVIAQGIDYRLLIDDYWNYLYRPTAEWGKFTKIATFLWGVWYYITSHNLDSGAPSYYRDMAQCDQLVNRIVSVATTNYRTFIDQELPDQIFLGRTKNITHLNGTVTEFYDPYLNEVITVNSDGRGRRGTADSTDVEGLIAPDSHHHVLVPLFFTQNGVKPITNIKKIQSYQKLYESWIQSSELVIVGYSFSDSDAHINGMLRSLFHEPHHPLLIVVDKADEINKPDYRKRLATQLRLRVQDVEQIKLVSVETAPCRHDSSWLKGVI